MEGSDSILRGIGQSVGCRGEESWESGLKVGGKGRGWEQENRKTGALCGKGIESRRDGAMRERCKVVVTAAG